MPIDPDATVHEGAKIHPTAVIERRAIIGDKVEIGEGCVVKANAQIANRLATLHKTTIEAGAVIGDGARLEPGCTIRERATLGTGATVGSHALVGQRSRLGGGCSVGDAAEIGEATEIGRDARMGDGVKIGPRSGRKAREGDSEQPTRIGARTTVANARVHAGAQVGQDCDVSGLGKYMPHGGDAPQIGADAQIGDRCRIHGKSIGRNAEIGDDCHLAKESRVGKASKLGDKVEMEQGAVVGNGTTVGRECRLATGADIDGGCAIGPGVILEENSWVGEGATLEKDVQIGRDARVGNAATIEYSVQTERDSRIGEGVRIGNHTTVGEDTEIGCRRLDDTVPDTRVGSDCTIESDVEIGADVSIGDGCLIEEDANLNHGARVGEEGVVGAGSTMEVDAQVAAGTNLPPASVLTSDGTCLPAIEDANAHRQEQKTGRYYWVEVERNGNALERNENRLGDESRRIHLDPASVREAVDAMLYATARSKDAETTTISVVEADRIPEWATDARGSRDGDCDVHRTCVAELENGAMVRYDPEDAPRPGGAGHETVFHAAAVLKRHTPEAIRDNLTVDELGVNHGIGEDVLRDEFDNPETFLEGEYHSQDAFRMAKEQWKVEDVELPVHYVPGAPEKKFEPGVRCPPGAAVKVDNEAPAPRRLAPGEAAPGRPAVSMPPPAARQKSRGREQDAQAR